MFQVTERGEVIQKTEKVIQVGKEFRQVNVKSLESYCRFNKVLFHFLFLIEGT